MKSLLSKSITAASLLGLTACGVGADLGPLTAFEAQKSIAPTNQAQAESEIGIYGLAEAELASALATHPSLQYREVNKAHGLYTLKGLSREQVEQLFPDHLTIQNDFVANQNLNLDKSPQLLAQELIGSARFSEVEIKREKLNRCNFDDPNKPIVKLTTEVSVLDLDSEIQQLEVGQRIQLDANGSEPNANHDSPVKIGMIVQPPTGSKVEAQVTLEGKLEFTLDSVGVFEVLTIVQDERDVCEVKVNRFGATSNAKYVGPTKKATENNLGEFKHLVELQARAAWEISTGEGVVVAVVDSGVNYNHPHLRNNIFINEGEIADNGIDDDGNGMVDDRYGYDLHDQDPYGFDDYGHGSHVAGLIASETFGMAKDAKIIPVKAGGLTGLDRMTLIGSVFYAADAGAEIINMSFGAYARVNSYRFVMEYLEEKGVLAVAASGNGHPSTGFGVNIDTIGMYPAADQSENILSIAAKDSFNMLSPYSNYGVNSVDMTAPGGLGPDDFIMSATAENAEGIMIQGMMGTSMAAPIAAGVAAQVLAIDPDLSPAEVIEILQESGKSVEGLDKFVKTGKTLQALAAVELAVQKLQAKGGSLEIAEF
ncbi:MAG: S8 family serine peptidase [Bdellovibrionales bacterium]|nr:S8 family serine peptidase [Bdellovibrionales bacterium]